MVNTVSDHLTIGQHLEGNRVADLQWGTANAKQIIINGRIVVSGDYVQKICLSVRNAAYDRSYIVEILDYNTGYIDTTFTAVIPGCTTGTWNKDALQGMSCFVSLYAGTNYRTAPNTWATGNFLGSTNMNSANTPTFGATVALSSMGLYADPYKTGVAPPFQMPDYAQELRRCQRYWYRCYSTRGGVSGDLSQMQYNGAIHAAPMRATPAASVVGAPNVYDGTTPANITSVINNVSNAHAAQLHLRLSANLAVGRASVQYWQSAAHYIAMSARF